MKIIDQCNWKKPVLATSKEEQRALFLEAYAKDTGNKKILYLHMPYCNGKCRFCICPSISYRTESDIDVFARDVLPAQIAEYRSLLEHTRFDEVYFGGGTPTLLSTEQLEAIFACIPHFDEIPVKSFEGSPSTVTFEHLALLKKYGFSYLSFGVQSLDEDLCRWQNRTYVSKEQLAYIASAVLDSGLFLNMDLICYLGAGDLTDLPDFERDLDTMMREIRPSSICIHQHLQARFTCEKTKYLIRMMQKKLETYPEYECINSHLKDEDVYEDTIHRAEYRLVRENRQYRNYMWKKFPSVPIDGYDVLALGYIPRVNIKSNAGPLLYEPSTDKLSQFRFAHELTEKEALIRKEKGLPI